MYVVVAGGGLAGLVAARHLAESGIDVELFEVRSRIGGRVKSRSVDGYTLDRGFQVLFTAYPAARRELDYDALDLRPFSPGATIARPNHRSTLADPFGDPGAALPTLLNRDVRTADTLRLFRLQRKLRRREWDGLLDGEDGRTIREYLADRGFSTAFLERFAVPFYGGITLDRSLGTSSSVFEYTFKALSEGRIAVPAEGMGAISKQLRERAESAGATIETGVAVAGLDDGLRLEIDGGSRSPDAVVVATDPVTAGELTNIDTPAGTKGCVTVHCSIPEHQSLDTDSRIVLNAAGGEPNTVAPMSVVAPEYAPDGKQLLSATFLGEREETDGVLGAIVKEALEAWFPENHFGEFDVVGVDRVEFAQFSQPPGFRGRVPSVDAPDGAIYLAGDYTQWSSIQGALESGKLAADAVFESR